jgi:hypothetical protein
MRTPKGDKVGSCALCRAHGALCDSHIISEFLYSDLYDDKHRFHVLQAGKKNSRFEQKGFREPLLCPNCETTLSEWETYACEALTGGQLFQHPGNENLTWLEGIDYTRFKLFQLSNLWRAGVAKNVFFSKVRLGAHAQALRRMLLAGDPGEPWQYGCLMIRMHQRGDAVPVIVQPTRMAMPDGRYVRFTFASYFWAYRISSDKPADPAFSEAVLQRSGRLALMLQPLDTAGFHWDFVRNHERKQRGRGSPDPE